MKEFFLEPIRKLPEAEIPLSGIRARLSQSESHQIVFMEFAEDVLLPEHTHAAQWGIVLQGEIELTIGGKPAVYRKGDTYFIPNGVTHSGQIRAGFVAMDFFDQPDRYGTK